MKRTLFFLLLLAFLPFASVLRAQAPQAVTLQSVLRDAAGRLVANRNVSVLISLRRGSNTGTVVYSETHTPTTNQNGLYTVFFGRGTAVTGTFASIDWALGPYYATVEADPTGGSNYTLTVSHPIVSVPYALFAEQVHEQQTLSLSNDTIWLTGGSSTNSFVKLPAMGGGAPSGCVPSCGRIDTIEHKLDSIINLSCIATVHYVSQSACDSYTWAVTGQTYNATGVYTYTRARGNRRGCDSIEMLTLTINRSTHNVEKQNVTGFLTWHGTAYANTGTYTYSYNNSVACPSVDTLKLTVNTVGSLPGEFSVSATKKVRFSRGNLQYQASSNTWRFATNQYTRVGNAEANTNMTSTNTNWIDLFGWGTSGQQNQADPGCTNYRPWSNATGTGVSAYNDYGYGPSTNMVEKNLTGAGNINDWGVVNSISNGGMRPGLWRTLTTAEWNYLFSTRTVNFARFCFAQVNGVNGIILFPDSYSHPSTVAAINNTNDFNRAWGDNPISAAGWTVMEAAGAVFLPAAGYRQGNTVYNDNAYGRYWSATYYDKYYAYSVFFQNTASRTNFIAHLATQHVTVYNGEGTWDGVDHSRWNSRRWLGMSVRLVQDIN